MSFKAIFLPFENLALYMFFSANKLNRSKIQYTIYELQAKKPQVRLQGSHSVHLYQIGFGFGITSFHFKFFPNALSPFFAFFKNIYVVFTQNCMEMAYSLYYT